MLRNTTIAAAASLAFFAAAASQALDLNRPPFHGGDSVPIEPGVLDPVNDCFRFPELCGPPDVPPDPCIEHPELCDPPDPCELNPLLCNPVDPCELAPALCEDPPVADPGSQQPPEQETFQHSLAGTARVKGEGFKTAEPYTLLLNVDTAARTFSAMNGAGTLYTGSVAPKGKKGVKLSLFLDPASSGAFSADVAARGASASGRAAGSVLGGSAKLVLKRKDDGSVSLKIKSEVLSSGVGEVVFKANLLSQ